MGVIEFQAVVMAGGKGSRMTEITAGLPKCLLPIGNQPMVWYSLQMLERAGFQEAIVIVQESVRNDVQSALERCGLKIHLDIIGIPGGEDWGTADSLRFISKKITSDILVLSCDLITDFNLGDVISVFRKHQASIATLFFPASSDSPGIIPGPKSKNKPERDLVGIDPETSRLVYLRSASDFQETVTLPKALLKKHHRVTIQSRLVDSHLYIIRKWICDFLAQEKSFSTLKGELLPYVVKQQLVKRSKLADRDPNASIVAVDTKKDIFRFACESPLDATIRSLSTFNDHTKDMRPAYLDDVVRCYGYVAPKTCFGVRANTLAAFCVANNKIISQWASVTSDRPLTKVNASAEVKSTQVDDQCLVGDLTHLSEKTSFTSSHIGANCVVEARVRLVNCVLMNGVKIREGCVLTNCIVCNEAEIGTGSELRDCLVGSNHSVPLGAKHANEALTDLDSLMEI